MLNVEFIIYGAIFVGVLVLVEGAYLVIFGKSISLNSKVNRRLQMLDKGTRREEVLATLRKEMDQHSENRGLPIYSLLADR
ncbi:MAG: pilus assembly protein TadB, partial [Pseudomonadota bacterium]|nr:pilus assembly protein TadB [Pseudomonadota bacterium]